MTQREIEDWQVSPPQGAPPDVLVLAPPNVEAIARVLRWASLEGRSVMPWGGGTHCGPAAGDTPEILLRTNELTSIVDYQPDDLTLVVEAGALVSEVESMLAERSQSAVLQEHAAGSTIGGMIASGASGYRRLRYGPTRDRMLEATVATGDGRVITAGGRVVKNVTGYDIPRLMSGSLGSLGVMSQVCLKLWPVPATAASIDIDVAAFPALYRPLALLETEQGATAYLAGTAEEIAGQANAVGADPVPGLNWPAPLDHASRIEMRVPSPLVTAAVEQVKAAEAVAFRAQHGVGIVEAGFADWSDERLKSLRDWAERHSGHAVVTAAPTPDLDRWGAPPDSVELQRRVKEAFDPRHILVPGRLPGGV
ncbi:MAG: FAD-binding oxidoreductase [Acidimicrobiia bacterium]|nr:FAD-binding oxidoreductase [Acidimicrobiia bacterium]